VLCQSQVFEDVMDISEEDVKAVAAKLVKFMQESRVFTHIPIAFYQYIANGERMVQY
jgi:hypothetical protein